MKGVDKVIYTIDNTKDITMCHPTVFAANFLVDHLKDEPMWTMSSRDKRPIDAKVFLESNAIEDAYLDGPSPLVTLPELDADDRLQAVNRAYRLHAKDNRVIAIDVEPEATDAMKEMVLNFPSHYTELSMNGGVHLFIMVPEDLVDDHNRYMFDDLSVFKEPIPDGENRPAHFEVIFNDHYITFTKRMLTQKPCVNYATDPQAKAQLKAFLDNIVKIDAQKRADRELAKQYKVELFEHSMEPEQLERIETFTELIAFDTPKQQAGEKQASDYGGDNSRYEMSTASFIAAHVIKKHRMAKGTLSFSELASKLKEPDLIYAVYHIIKDILPYREKHDEYRDDLPWLMYTSKGAYEYIKAQNAKERQTKNNK